MVPGAEVSADEHERIPRAETRLCSLQKSAAVAMIFIRIAERKALALEAGEAPEGDVDPLDMFVKASRMLHDSVARQARVEKELAALRAGDPLVETTPRYGRAVDLPNPGPDRVDVRDSVHGSVLELIDPDLLDSDEGERIYAELNESLYESGRYDDVLDLPREELVELICKDLGVKPDWASWDGYDWPPWRTDKTRGPAPPGSEDGDLEGESAPAGIPPHPPP